MFWGLVIKPNLKYSSVVKTPFHVSQAVLDIANTPGDSNVKLTLWSEKQNAEYILCILNKSERVQVPLDLIFSRGDKIFFRSVGGTVHLTGYAKAEEIDPEAENAETSVGNLHDTSDGQSTDGNTSGPPLSAGNVVAEEIESEAENAEMSVDNSHDTSDTSGQTDGNASGSPLSSPSTPSSPAPSSSPTPRAPKVEDIRIGSGDEATSGRGFEISYNGRLKSATRAFDISRSYMESRFIVGQSTTSKKWLEKVVGMKVGGKRRITFPAGTYCVTGDLQPANEAVIFEIVLRNVF